MKWIIWEKKPVLQLTQSNSILTLSVLNEQVVREKHVLGTHVMRTR